MLIDTSPDADVGSMRLRSRWSRQRLVVVILLSTVLLGVVYRKWSARLSDSERRLVGKWTYRTLTREGTAYVPKGERHVIEFRNDRIAVNEIPDRGFVGYLDWRIDGQTLVFTEYQYRPYGESTIQKTNRAARWFNGMLRGQPPGVDLTTFQDLVWKSNDEVEWHYKSPGDGQVYVISLTRMK